MFKQPTYLILFIPIQFFGMDTGYIKLNETNPLASASSQTDSNTQSSSPNQTYTTTLEALRLSLPYLKQWKEQQNTPMLDPWNNKFINVISNGIINTLLDIPFNAKTIRSSEIIAHLNGLFTLALETSPDQIIDTNKQILRKIKGLAKAVKSRENVLNATPFKVKKTTKLQKLTHNCYTFLIAAGGIGFYIWMSIESEKLKDPYSHLGS